MDLLKFIENFERELEKRDISFFPLDFVHGYLTGIGISPRMIMPNEWVNHLLKNEIEFKSNDDAEFIFSFLLELYSRIIDEIYSGEITPLLPEIDDENGVRIEAEGWCRGFIFASSFFSNEFSQYMEEDDDNLIDILILSYLAGVGETSKLVLQQIIVDWEDDDLELIDEIPAIILSMYDYFRRNFSDGYDFDDEFGGQKKIKPIKKATPKIGRNDPCPCGSGKKYKHCCGKNIK